MKKVLALVLAVCMCISCAGTLCFAAGGNVQDSAYWVVYHDEDGTSKKTVSLGSKDSGAEIGTLLSAAEAGVTVPTGKTFKGWSKTKGGTTLVKTSDTLDSLGGNVSDTGPNGWEISLYPVWEDSTGPTPPEVKNYTVKYDANGGTGTMNDGSFNDENPNSAFTLAASTFTPPANKEFDYWSYSKTADGKITGNPLISDLITQAGNGTTVTVYAMWKDKVPGKTTITLNYSAEGATGTVPKAESQQVDEGAKATFTVASASTLSKEGYNFKGWTANTETADKIYAPGDTIELSKSTTLYAVWEKKIVYQVTYYANGENKAFDVVVPAGATFGTTVAISWDKVGYTLLGWTTDDQNDNNPEDVMYKPGATIEVKGNMNLFAIWNKDFEDDEIKDELNKIPDAAVDDMTEEELAAAEKAVDNVLENASAETLKYSPDFVEMIEKLDEIYAKAKDITVEEPSIEASAVTSMEAAGVALNGESGKKAQLVAADVPKNEEIPAESLEDAAGRELANEPVQFSITLEIGGEASNGILTAPIKITMNVPEGVTANSSLRIFNDHNGDLEMITPDVSGSTMTFWVTKFSTFAVANITTGGGSTGGSGGGGGGGSSSGGNSAGLVSGMASKASTAVSAAQPAKAADVTKAADKAVSAAIAAGTKTASVMLKNVSTITPAMLKSVADAAKKAGVAPMIYADTMNGNVVAGRLYVDPSKYTLAADMNLSMSLEDKAVQALFDKYFANTVKLVKFAQKGSFGMEVQAAVKLDLSKLNTAALRFYAYDVTTNQYVLIANPRYSVDSNGYLHFFTTMGNHVIITDKPLTLK